jgi:hypothetical protein
MVENEADGFRDEEPGQHLLPELGPSGSELHALSGQLARGKTAPEAL